jgi:hypothetical protein
MVAAFIIAAEVDLTEEAGSGVVTDLGAKEKPSTNKGNKRKKNEITRQKLLFIAYQFNLFGQFWQFIPNN